MSNQSPKVSIGIPVFKVDSYIERCAHSLFQQTYLNIEYVFVDDCSPDQSIDILKKVVSIYPARDVTIVSHKTNLGLSAARNTAIKKMTGEFVLWVDSDDWVETDLIEKVVKKQQETNADIVLFNAISHFANGKILPKKQPESITSSKGYTISLIKKMVPHEIWGRLIRLKLYTDNSIECLENVNIGEDFQVTPRLAYFSSNINCLPEYLYHYNCCNASALTKNGSIEQSWKTIDSVYSFFSNIDEDYLNAAEWMRLWSISCDFVSYGKYNATECFLMAKNRLSTIDRKKWKLLPISRRSILYLANYPMLVRLYGKIASTINNFCR